MSRLVVVVKSHLFPPFVRLNREIGTSRRHWGDGEFPAVNRKPRWAGTIPGSYMGRRQSSQSRWTGNPSEARRRRQLLTTLTHNRYLVRRTWYTVGGHTANTDTRVIFGGRRGSVVLAGERTPGKAAAVTRERGEVARAACSLARAVSCTWAAPGQRENTETVAKQKQLPSAGLVPNYHALGARPEDHVSANY